MSQRDDEANQLLEGAYALQTPADNLSYYRDFATHYDASFADAMGYVYPGLVARHMADIGVPAGPILDIGCGTGLVAAHLHENGVKSAIEGVDLSPEMLEIAASKSLYTTLYQLDLTAPLAGLPHHYAGLISAGTFTHGHIGPDPLVRLVSHCQPGAQAVIGVNAVHYRNHGFADRLDRMAEGGAISAPLLKEVKIFDGADAAHAEDTAFILTFSVC